MDSTVQSKPRRKQTQKIHKCKVCDKTFSGHLKQHMRTHEQPEFACTLCNYTANQQGNLTRHILSHTKEKPYKCQHPNCDAAFSISSNLERHQWVHNQNDKLLPIFECPSQGCLYKTKNKKYLDQHVKTHSDEKLFACDLCPFRARVKSILASHNKNIHSTNNEKPFKCPLSNCTYSCKQKSLLTQHMKIHSDVKPFTCSFPDCTFKSKRKGHLERHERIHRGEKPFSCTLCPYSCGDQFTLVAHTRVHTGETPYSCQSCCFQTKSSGCLSRHVKNRHLDKKGVGKRCKSQARISPTQSPTLQCKVATCDYSTTENCTLAMHFSLVHNLPQVVLM